MLTPSMSKDHVFEMSIVLSVKNPELGEVAMELSVLIPSPCLFSDRFDKITV